MSIAVSSSALQPKEYDAIEAAIVQTARGRGFLAEYARRARAAETDRLRAALARIEARLDSLVAPPAAEAVPIIARLEAMVWKLRESGVDDFVCGRIEALAREIAIGGVILDASAPMREAPSRIEAPKNSDVRAETRCAVPLPPGGGIGRVVAESRIDRVTPSPNPSPQGGGELLANPGDDADAPAIDASSIAGDEDIPAPAADPRLDALLWLDRLPILDRMALFA